MQPSTDHKPSGRIAVADSHGIYTASGYERFAPHRQAGRPPEPPWFSFAELERRGIRQYWHTDLGDLGEPYYRPAGAERLRVCVPARSPGLAMWDLPAARLFAELVRFELATGGELFIQSAAVTSDSILRHCHQGPGTRPVSRTQEPAIARRHDGRPPEAAEGDLVWWAAGPPAGGRYVHHFDLNAAYLGSAGTLALPQGEPRYWQGPQVIDTKPKRAGYWRVALPLPARSGGWPPIARNRGMRARRGEEPAAAWISTPTLELAVSLAPVKVLEGWYWPNTCQGLRPWYERLRDARAALKSGPAFDAVKMIYRAGIGRLGSYNRAQGESDPLFQPTWRHMVIAEARSRVWRRIAKAPTPPIAVQVDGAWWLSDIKDPVQVAAWLGLDLDPIKLGAWKHSGSGPGGKAAKALAAPNPIAALREITHA